MKKVSIIASSLLVATALAFAPAVAQPERAAKFTSLYTDLNKDCRSALTKAQEREAERIGDDIPMVCKGYGGYEISLASHGTMTLFEVRKRGGESVVQETMFIGDPIYTRKVEWRLADGVPFAVIYRRDVNDEPEDQSQKKKIGEVLRVVGLQNKKIDFEVDVKKSPNPNAEARRLADRAYMDAQ